MIELFNPRLRLLSPMIELFNLVMELLSLMKELFNLMKTCHTIAPPFNT